MKILCRVDGNTRIGTGHLMRCLALSQAFESENISFTFVIHEETLELCQDRDDWVGEIVVVPEKLSQEDEISWLESNVEHTQFQAMLIDGYQFNSQYRFKLKSLNIPLLMFDDNNDSGMLYADLVINCVINALALDYTTTAPGAVLCLGSEYTVLRREFTEQTVSPWEQRTCLTIIMGGSDPMNISLPLLEALQKQNAKMPIHLITGTANPAIDNLKCFINKSTLDLHHHHNCQNVARIFSKSKLVVSAAGSSQNELLACATPTLLTVIADNQLNASQNAEQQGTSDVHNYLQNPDVNELAAKSIVLWKSEDKLKAMHNKANKLRDVCGAGRIVQEVIKLIKHNPDNNEQ